MFGFLFCRWRKASTCKKLLQQLQSRLKLLKNKKYAISRHLRSDIALFIRINDSTRALLRTEQLILVENSVLVYDLLLQFTDLIILHFPSIRKNRKLVNDEINEAVSSLVFASARFGELRELGSIKEMFGQRYGERYVTSALQLLPGNHVNHQIKENFSVSEDVKSRLLDEIAKESGHRLEILRLEYKPDTEKQVNEEEEKKVIDSDLNGCSDEQSPDEIYKFSLTDVEEERSNEEAPMEGDYIEDAQVGKVRSRESSEEERSNEKASMEDDYIDEAQVGKDQRVFRFRESSEEDRSNEEASMEDDYIKEAQVGKDQRVLKESSEEERRSSSSSSSLRESRDMECMRYYKRRNRSHRRRRSSPSSHCYHIIYNVFNVTKEEEEEERRRLFTKHVHPKLPDYDQVVTQFKALRKQQYMHC